jgi:hypothetical protein
MKVMLVVLLFILGILLVLAVGGGLLVLMAYGVGWVLNHIMHLDPFQTTVLSLAGICVFGILATRIWEVVANPPHLPSNNEYDDEFEDEFDEEDEDEEPTSYPGVPRWRQPLKTPDFSNIKPDDRCPCGSGRKFKNCHGSKQAN